MLIHKFNELMAPDDVGGGSGSTAEMGKEEMIEFLADETEEKEVIPLAGKKEADDKEKDTEEEETPEETKESEEETDELAELEDELEEPTEEQLELVTPVRRREILAKYPKLFKEFPYLEKAYYREQQFTELLPTIEDAKAAVQAKEILTQFESDVMQGNTETILKTVKSENPEAFNRIVDDYLLAIRRVDEVAFQHIIRNTSKTIIMSMIQEGNRTGNEALQTAAQIFNQFMFGTSDFTPPTNLSKPERPEDKGRENQLSQREQAFVQQQFNMARDGLDTRVNNALRNTIDANIDPKKSMSDYVRRNASRDALEQLESLISRDSRFKTLVDKLWEKAFQDGFNHESTERIRSAYLSKSKTLLPSVIKKARIEALRGIGKRVVDEEDRPDKKGPITSGRPRSQSSTTSGKITKPEDIPKGMRTIDFLMQE